MLEEKYKDLNEEAQSKTRKLKKLRTMILKSESEMKDIQEEHQRMKESLLDSVRELTRELKLQIQIIDTYIPIEFQGLIEENIMWNEELGEFQLKCIAYTGNNIRKPKEKEIDKEKMKNMDFNHVYLSYSNDGSDRAVKTNKRAKSGKKNRQ